MRRRQRFEIAREHPTLYVVNLSKGQEPMAKFVVLRLHYVVNSFCVNVEYHNGDLDAFRDRELEAGVCLMYSHRDDDNILVDFIKRAQVKADEYNAALAKEREQSQ